MEEDELRECISAIQDEEMRECAKQAAQLCDDIEATLSELLSQATQSYGPNSPSSFSGTSPSRLQFLSPFDSTRRSQRAGSALGSSNPYGALARTEYTAPKGIQDWSQFFPEKDERSHDALSLSTPTTKHESQSKKGVFSQLGLDESFMRGKGQSALEKRIRARDEAIRKERKGKNFEGSSAGEDEQQWPDVLARLALLHHKRTRWRQYGRMEDLFDGESERSGGGRAKKVEEMDDEGFGLDFGGEQFDAAALRMRMAGSGFGGDGKDNSGGSTPGWDEGDEDADPFADVDGDRLDDDDDDDDGLGLANGGGWSIDERVSKQPSSTAKESSVSQPSTRQEVPPFATSQPTDWE